jgi:hypothetical protein
LQEHLPALAQNFFIKILCEPRFGISEDLSKHWIRRILSRIEYLLMNKHHPFHPIIYVRGFAATHGEIEDAVADPYMGFNIGSTKARTVWTGDVKRFFFESPLVRLMSDHDYDDVFVAGEDLLMLETSDRPLQYRCIIIYRYYDEASEAFGTRDTPPITHFGRGLSELIVRLRRKVCENPANEVTPAEFRCYLVAHSMGGLVCRAFLHGKDDKGELGTDEARQCVDKLFTYATPHNGIDLRIVRNVPAWATFGDVNNFNREKMAKYLNVGNGDDVSLVRNFPPERVFNLVGTNPSDYRVLAGLSAWAAGEASDGLVRIDNATTHGASKYRKDIPSPRAFVHRSHSGHYGIVNSEEGYQNLTRFLFGSLRVDGILEIDDITLPLEVQKMLDEKKAVRASYQFEIVVSVRGCQWQMHRRTVRENSAIFRSYDQLFPGREGTRRPPDRTQSPHLFSVFLDPSKSVMESGSVSFGFDLRVLVPDYEVDGILYLKRHYEGGYLYRELILVEAIPDTKSNTGWRIKYGFQEANPGRPGKTAETQDLENESGFAFDIPIEQKRRPGLTGTLRIECRPWT